MNFTTEQLATPVFVYIKQDYDYRGLDEIASGKIVLGDIVNMFDENTRETAEKEICKKLNGTDTLRYSFMTCCYEDTRDTVMSELLNDKMWSDFDEIGYIALSLESGRKAKQEVARMILEQELGEDEEDEDF